MSELKVKITGAEHSKLKPKIIYTELYGPIIHFRVGNYDSWHWLASALCYSEYEIEMEDGGWKKINNNWNLEKDK